MKNWIKYFIIKKSGRYFQVKLIKTTETFINYIFPRIKKEVQLYKLQTLVFIIIWKPEYLLITINSAARESTSIIIYGPVPELSPQSRWRHSLSHTCSKQLWLWSPLPVGSYDVLKALNSRHRRPWNTQHDLNSTTTWWAWKWNNNDHCEHNLSSPIIEFRIHYKHQRHYRPLLSTISSSYSWNYYAFNTNAFIHTHTVNQFRNYSFMGNVIYLYSNEKDEEIRLIL